MIGIFSLITAIVGFISALLILLPLSILSLFFTFLLLFSLYKLSVSLPFSFCLFLFCVLLQLSFLRVITPIACDIFPAPPAFPPDPYYYPSLDSINTWTLGRRLSDSRLPRTAPPSTFPLFSSSARLYCCVLFYFFPCRFIFLFAGERCRLVCQPLGESCLFETAWNDGNVGLRIRLLWEKWNTI